MLETQEEKSARNAALGVRLRYWIRESTHGTVSKFALHTGVGLVGVHRVLRGVSGPSIGMLRTLKRADPRLSLDWLITGKGDAFDGTSQQLQAIQAARSTTRPREATGKSVGPRYKSIRVWEEDGQSP
jgi:hypothetical protein